MLVNLVVEIQNRQSLEIMLAREEEVKRRAIIHKEIYNGPQICYISRNGG
jgi:vacuolar protein sorting-associated protein 72